ncbi:MAG: hypothetical protein ABJA16_11480 [Nakamurella sp.]
MTLSTSVFRCRLGEPTSPIPPGDRIAAFGVDDDTVYITEICDMPTFPEVARAPVEAVHRCGLHPILLIHQAAVDPIEQTAA